MILKLLIWLILAPLGKAIVDWYIIERRKQPINHLLEWIFLGMGLILYGGAVLNAHQGPQGLMVFSYEVCSYYVFFEPLLNTFRRKPLTYLGKTAPTDIFLNSHRWLYWILKAGAVAGLIISAIYLLNQ